MIFDVSASQIESLESKQLVELLRKLLYAEAQCAGISLRGISVPLQITVPDGGEDARISWTGGLEQTDYLSARFCLFQSKATDLGPSGWKKEVWTKDSQKTGVTRHLNVAVQKAILERGSYIAFTSVALTGQKCDRRVDAIKDGIREAGADAGQLSGIHIYDANKIAGWASQHPGVALWINERQSGLGLRAFQTIESWGKRDEIASIQRVDDKAARFSLGNEDFLFQEPRETENKNRLTFQLTKERIIDYLANPQTLVRLRGPSGVGKTRVVYEIFSDVATVAKLSLSTLAFYCDYRDIGEEIFQIAQSLSETGSPAVMIVDECPYDSAERLSRIVMTRNSQLRVLAIGNDDQLIRSSNCLNISVTPGDAALIDGIVLQRFPKANESDLFLIKRLSGGYPRMAVLATDNYSEQGTTLKSVEEVMERILKGCGINEPDQLRSIECLALFERLGVDEQLSGQIDFVAQALARQTGDEMYEHLAKASRHQIVERRGGYFTVQPPPIAAFLGARRLDLLRLNTILHFIESARPEVLGSFLTQLRHFHESKTISAVTKRLLSWNGWLGSMEALNSELGSKCLDALVHVSPDTVADTITRVFGSLSVDELKDVKDGRRYLVSALEKLVFRKQSFHAAGRLLLKLAAAENETWGNNATGQFKQLFQLYLSGSEAEPADRFVVLDEGILSGDDRIILVCIKALENTLRRGHFSRGGGAENIGVQPPLKDWLPKVWGEVFDFHRSGLQRLNMIRSKYPRFSEQCETLIARNLRSLMYENLFDEIAAMVKKINAEKGFWLEAIKGIGDWLYFDRKGSSQELSAKIRELYESIMPTDPVGKALLYTKFWSADIYDPDLNYDDTPKDFEYSSRKAREIATEIAKDKTLTMRAINTMVSQELHSGFPFARELATVVDDPVDAFKIAITALEQSGDRRGSQFIFGMLTGVDQRDENLGKICVELALKSDALKDQTISIYGSVRITSAIINDVVQRLKNGTLSSGHCAALSYGRRLENLAVQDILPLIDELGTNHAAEGIWTALDIISMYQYDRKELDKQVADRIKNLVTSPTLLGELRIATRDGYLFEHLVALVQKQFGIDDEFASQLSSQITRLCQVSNHDVFYALDAPVGQIIRLLLGTKPKRLWDIISRFVEIATPMELHSVEQLLAPPLHPSNAENQNQEGVLFGVSETECIAWAKMDPPMRTPFLCRFCPLLTGDGKWHTAISRLANEFGTVKEFRDALERRLHSDPPTGSVIPNFELFLEPLKTWFTHPVTAMSIWARDIHQRLEKEIAWERERETESDR